MYRCSHPIIPIIRCAPVLDFTNRYLQLLCCHQHPSHPDNLQLPPCHTMQAKIFDDNNKNICCQLTKGTISPPTEVLSNWGRMGGGCLLSSASWSRCSRGRSHVCWSRVWSLLSRFPAVPGTSASVPACTSLPACHRQRRRHTLGFTTYYVHHTRINNNLQ